VRYAFPKASEFGRVVPKAKLLAAGRATPKARQSFTEDIGQIRWSHKLYPGSVNLPTRGAVEEIEVFTITLKRRVIPVDALRQIDKAVFNPILFTLYVPDETVLVAAYKRPSEADKSKTVVSEYFNSEWKSSNFELAPLPLATDIGALYTQILRSLMPYKAKPEEILEEQINRINEINVIKKTIKSLELRMRKETQVNRRIALNEELKLKKKHLRELVREDG